MIGLNTIQGLPYFIFNNISSEDYLIVNELPPIFKPEKSIEKIEIPGRDGFLTNDLGTYKSIIKSVECTISDIENIDFISNWLSGSGDVIFSNEPDRKFKAIINNQIEFSKILETYRKFIILFDCQPHKYSIVNDIITLYTGVTIYNKGNVKSKPVIKVYGTGSINLVVNSNIINLTNVSDYVTIDSELMDCYRDTSLKNNDMSGEFPELNPGSNTITWTGNVTKVDIRGNWRWV